MVKLRPNTNLIIVRATDWYTHVYRYSAIQKYVFLKIKIKVILLIYASTVVYCNATKDSTAQLH